MRNQSEMSSGEAVEYVQQVRTGDVTVTLMEIGRALYDFSRFAQSTERLPPDAEEAAAAFYILPLQSVHIATPRESILVDAGAYELSPELRPTLARPISGYLERSLEECLTQAKIDPRNISKVVITHAHDDHFNRLGVMSERTHEPLYPNATCYLGRGDWENIVALLADRTSIQSRAFGRFVRDGRLVVVGDAMAIAPEIEILPAPGESPGHQVVRVQSGPAVLYCVGDLYHLAEEVYGSRLNFDWVDAHVIQSVRSDFNRRASSEKALVVASHIGGFGRIEPVESSYMWTRVADEFDPWLLVTRNEHNSDMHVCG
jgi:glyoxylase-like metal-dependent hydrolase (beta-lactamase superfamily II)